MKGSSKGSKVIVSLEVVWLNRISWNIVTKVSFEA